MHRTDLKEKRVDVTKHVENHAVIQKDDQIETRIDSSTQIKINRKSQILWKMPTKLHSQGCFCKRLGQNGTSFPNVSSHGMLFSRLKRKVLKYIFFCIQ